MASDLTDAQRLHELEQPSRRRGDAAGTGEAARMHDVGVLFEELEEASQKFEESKQRRLERRIASAPADHVLTPPARPPMKGT
ncbi:hypothetical protein M4D79_27960 [Mycolicibacterium novocastrense]|nr:hypothetical protein M4D79_27960 [Mycolicibacterium novocastrense]